MIRVLAVNSARSHAQLSLMNSHGRDFYKSIYFSISLSLGQTSQFLPRAIHTANKLIYRQTHKTKTIRCHYYTLTPQCCTSIWNNSVI